MVEYSPVQEGKIYFGAWCELEDDEGQSVRFRIVGDEEIFGNNAYISLKSPMAKACLGKTLDDEVSVQTPSGDIHWYVVKIEYNVESDLSNSADPRA